MAKAKETRRIEGPKPWQIAKIIEYKHNARTHPPAQIDLLATLMEKFGIDQPIVVDEAGVILKGHGRKLGAVKLGLKSYPLVMQHFGLSDDEKTAMRIADNQVALLAEWDSELVSFEIKRLERSGYDVKLLGFGEKELVSFTTQPGPPSEFKTFDESVPTEHECPKCGYRWSGSTSPKAPEEKEGKKAHAK